MITAPGTPSNHAMRYLMPSSSGAVRGESLGALLLVVELVVGLLVLSARSLVTVVLALRGARAWLPGPLEALLAPAGLLLLFAPLRIHPMPPVSWRRRSRRAAMARWCAPWSEGRAKLRRRRFPAALRHRLEHA